MEHSELYTYLAVATTMPLAIPFVVLLVDQWILPMKAIRLAGLTVAVGALAADGAIYYLFGAGHGARTFAGTVPILIAWGLFFLFTRFRDGRFLFTSVTVALLATVISMVCCLLFPVDGVMWLAAKAAISLALLPVFHFVCRKPFLRMLHFADAGWVWLTLIPLSLLIAIDSGYLLPVFSGSGTPDIWTAVALSAITPLIYVTIYRFLQSMQAQYLASQNEAVLVAQIHALEQQTERMLYAERMNRIFRHDLRHFLQLLQSSVQAGDTLHTMEVVRSMDRELTRLADANKLHRYTGNVLIDTVLSIAAAQAAEANVTYTVQLTLPEYFEVDMTELAVVLLNALENALHACRELPDDTARTIRVTDGGAQSPFFLMVENTIRAPVMIDPASGLPCTNLPGHGYGAQSIASFAKKYGAVLDYGQTRDTFTLRLLFPTCQ